MVMFMLCFLLTGVPTIRAPLQHGDEIGIEVIYDNSTGKETYTDTSEREEEVLFPIEETRQPLKQTGLIIEHSGIKNWLILFILLISGLYTSSRKTRKKENIL